jgi:hypothetical protein
MFYAIIFSKIIVFAYYELILNIELEENKFGNFM